MRKFHVILAAALAACSPASTLTGGAMLNVQPTRRPAMVGDLDFDLMGSVRGEACVRKADASGVDREYWIGVLPFEGTPPRDPLTLGAIAAASTDATERVKGADTILVTRVLTEGKSPDEVCAYVYGRAVRLKKAIKHSHSSETAPVPEDEEKDDDDDDDDAGTKIDSSGLLPPPSH
jgi:hypothetical protein